MPGDYEHRAVILCKTGERGFSLVELAIAIAIIGLVAGATLTLYQGYIRTKAENDTTAREEIIRDAIARFVATHGYLPCPADPSLSLTNQNSGVELRDASGCLTNSPHVVQVNGYRDVDGTPGPDPVVIGALPYAALNMTMIEGYDGWGSSFTYAVTRSLTAPSTFNEGHGVIRVQAYANPTGGSPASVANPRVVTEAGAQEDSFMFVVVGHGPDKKGSYTNAGVAQTACGGAGRDVQNCNKGNATFVLSARNYLAGANFYDDSFVIMDYVRLEDRWYQPGMAKTSAGTLRSTASAAILPEGRVIIGVTDDKPSERLRVQGNIRAREIHTSALCDENGVNCTSPDMIGGKFDCDGGYLKGISGGKPVCANLVRESGVTTGICPGGTYLKGYCPGGIVWCSSDPDPCP